MAMCSEGGTGAHVAYVKSSDNRGAGSWVGNKLHNVKDGKRILFIISAGDSSGKTTSTAAASKPTATAPPPAKSSSTVYYKNCAAVRAAGKAPLDVGDPGHSPKLDRDKDGIACE